jgi:hypothetical protein
LFLVLIFWTLACTAGYRQQRDIKPQHVGAISQNAKTIIITVEIERF